VKNLLTLIVCALVYQSATAAPIQFIHSGVGSGTIGGTPFQDAAFVFEALADTDDRGICSIDEKGQPDCFTLEHQSATVEIDGLGTFAFVSGTRTFTSLELRMIGFSRGENEGSHDLYDGPRNDVFSSWNMLSSIGPVLGNASLFQWVEDRAFPGIRPAVETTAGVLLFDDRSKVPATFRAIVQADSNGDTNGDGLVDLEDLNNVRNNFGGTGLGDTSPFDGDVDLDDLNAVRNNFGAGGANPVPEPASIALLVVSAGLPTVLRRRTSAPRDL
jgi:hypothetical protein